MNTSRGKRNSQFMHRNIEAMFCLNIIFKLVIVNAKPRKQGVVGGAEGRLHPILLAYAQVLIVDRRKLEEAQQDNDPAQAQEILQTPLLQLLQGIQTNRVTLANLEIQTNRVTLANLEIQTNRVALLKRIAQKHRPVIRLNRIDLNSTLTTSL